MAATANPLHPPVPSPAPSPLSPSEPLLPQGAEAHAQLDRLWRPKPGFVGWLSTVDHKNIGIRYIVTAFIFFLLGGIAALLMRIQLMYPENTFLNPEQYNQLFSTHGITMMFLFAVPVMEGVGIYLVPLMIGSREVAFPKLNTLGYYLFALPGLLIWLSLFLGTAPNAGWFAYAPLTQTVYTPTYGMDVYATIIEFTEISSLIPAVVLIVTIFKFRAPGMALFRMPIFVWSMLVTSFMIVFAMPSIIVASTELSMERTLGSHFFDPTVGGNPLLWQHLFWFFGHPEVYIIFLPALGMVSEVTATFTRRPMVGYPFIVLAFVAIAVVSFGLWTHHMFATGLPVVGLSFFTVASMEISIPSGIQIFAALATLAYGKWNLKTPLLYILGFIITFVIGGISGVMVAAVPFDWQATDTYFVVAHLHYVLIGGAVFPLFAGFYYWFPKITGKMLDERLGQWNFWLTFIGFNVAFFPMHITGLLGMPRRYYTYPAGIGWDGLNFLSTIGALILACGILLLVINVIRTLYGGAVAGDNPWQAGTLEWATTSPPQSYSFEPLPTAYSRHPLWEKGPYPTAYSFKSNLERRETLGTSAAEARPEMRIWVAGDSIVPFITTLAGMFAFIATLFSLTWTIVGTILLFVMLIIWHWPKRRDREMEWVKSGPPGALPVDVVVRPLGLKPPYYYGAILLLVIEMAELAMLVATYFYLRVNFDKWPPGDLTPPPLPLPTLAVLLLLAALIPTYLGDKAIKHNNQRGLLWSYVVGTILFGAFIVVQFIHLSQLSYSWDTNAYSSILWLLIGFHWLFTLGLVIEQCVFIALSSVRYFNGERNSGVEYNGLNSYFTIFTWVPVYFIIYVLPKLHIL